MDDRVIKQMIYEKTGRIRFVSHLDMLRVFQRAIARAGLPIRYSQGFNPHPQTRFAQPLSLGVCGEREYMEMELTRDVPDVQARLNAELPPGLIVHAVHTIEKSTIALAQYAKYVISLPQEVSLVRRYTPALEQFLQRERIEIQKISKENGKKVMKTIDLKPLITEMVYDPSQCAFLLTSVCDVSRNVKPDRLMKVFWETMDRTDCIGEESILRKDLLLMREEALISLENA